MNALTLGVRNAFRNSVRSGAIIIILGLSIGLCLVMLIAYQAVGAKITGIKSSIGNTITVAPAGFSSFSSANNALSTTDLAKVAALPHVALVTETLTDRLTTIGSSQPSFGRFGGDNASSTAQTSLKSPITLDASGANNGRSRFFVNGGGSLPTNFSLPISIVGTTDPAKLDSSAAVLKSGKILDGTKDGDGALVSTTMANKNNLKVGSTFTAYGKTLTITGIFDAGNQAANGTVVVSLPALQRLTGQSGDVTSASVTADSLDNLSSLTSAVKSTLGSTADVTSAQDEANATVQPLENVQTISLVSLVGAVIAGGMIILLTMVMIVRERRREIGILKAIGGSNRRVIMQFVSEALTLTLVGALVGILIGVAGGNPVTNMLVSTAATSSSTTTTDGAGARFRSGFGSSQGFAARPLGGNFLQRGGNGLADSVSNITANVGWSILGYGLLAALVIAAIGSAFAGLLIVRVKPYEVMRSE